MIVSRAQRIGFSFYAGIILLVFYFPLACLVIGALSKKRYFTFPYPSENITWKWFGDALNSPQVAEFFGISLKIAGLATLCSLGIGFFGALAYARYAWRGRKTFQRLVLLPLFFPQSVLGLALLLWFNFLEITPSWQTAVISHTVWITPITTLIIAIQAYGLDGSLEEAARDMGATPAQILLRVTFPLLMPGVVSAACFAILLSWGNFALSLYTTGADSALPEWLYARMTSGYQPTVPAIGALSAGAAIVFIVILFGVLRWMAGRQKAVRAAES